MKPQPLLLIVILTISCVANNQLKHGRRHLQHRQKQNIEKRMMPNFELDSSKFYDTINKPYDNDNEFQTSVCQSGSCGQESNKETDIDNYAEGTPKSKITRGFNNCPANSHNNKAENIALKAAEEAKCASDAQTLAAEAAARHIKTHLAEKAMRAAKAAEAALSGKQQIVEQLEQEVHEAEAIVQEEIESLQITHNNADASMLASQQAGLQLKTLTSAVKIAEENCANAEMAAQGAAQEFNEKTKLVEAAKNRIELLLRQLCAARNDFDSTKRAAKKATCAAQEAKQKAARD